MKLNEIKETRIRHKEDEVNTQLKAGFKIVRILQSKSFNGEIEELGPCFVLGK